jgi:hypothetical protein
MQVIKEKLEMYKKEVECIRIIKILILLDLENLIFDIVNMYFSYAYHILYSIFYKCNNLYTYIHIYIYTYIHIDIFMYSYIY